MDFVSEEDLLASAMESMNIDHYWPESGEITEVDEENDAEYPIFVQFYVTLWNNMQTRNFVMYDDLPAIPRYKYFKDRQHCLAYLQAYAACHTTLVRAVLKRVFHACPPAHIRKMLCLKDSLDVVSLGGGPGNDLYGFCSALYGKHYGLQKLKLTVVDRNIRWKNIYFTSEKMIRTELFGDASSVFKDVEIETCFFEADLTSKVSWSDNLAVKIENADIFLLVKVLSEIPEDEKVLLLQSVVSMMKPGAVLIFIDYPFPGRAFSTVVQWLHCIYSNETETSPFKYEAVRYNHGNITASQVPVAIYVKKYISDPLNILNISEPAFGQKV